MGFAGAVGDTVPIGATYIYNLNFFAGFIVSSLTYYILCRIWPAKGVPDHWHEDGDQHVIEAREARISHVPSGEYPGDTERGDWKLDDERTRNGESMDKKLMDPSESLRVSDY